MASELYGTFGSVPDKVGVTGTGGSPLSVRADANDFGAQIGGAMQNLGAAGQQVGDWAEKHVKQAIEAKANNSISQYWIPAVAKMRSDYDNYQGADKAVAYENFTKNLREYQEKFIGTENTGYGKEILGNYTQREINSQVEGATKDLGKWQSQFNIESRLNLMMAQNEVAAQNYNNPEEVEKIVSMNDGQIAMNLEEQGVDIATPDGYERFQTERADNIGKMSYGMITRAIEKGDYSAACNIRSNFGTAIPGYRKLLIDDLISTGSLQQCTAQSIDSLQGGGPIQQRVDMAPIEIQASVASTAQRNGVNPNTALTYLNIESAGGANTGTRGTILQDKLGGSVEDQIARMPEQIKRAESIATSALGRAAEAWEGYVVHQQGEGGGADLLKDAQKPLLQQSKAIDVLKKFEGKEKGYSAYQALVQNGGDPSMSSGQFVGYLQTLWQKKYKSAEIRLAMNENGETMTDVGQQMLIPHDTSGAAFQQGENPLKTLQNFNEVAPAMIERIEAIPNHELRDNMMQAFTRRQRVYEAAAGAYQGTIQTEAQKLAIKPDFTSMDQVPVELRAKLADSPNTIIYLQQRAEYNQKRADGDITKDMQTYGVKYFDLFKDISAGNIRGVQQLQEHLNNGLTVSGYDKLVEQMNGTKTPAGKAEKELQATLLEKAKNELVPYKEDVAGMDKFSAFQIWFFDAFDKAKSEGKDPTELLNPDSPSYMGKAIPAFNLPPEERIKNRLKDPMEYEAPARTDAMIKSDFKNGKISRDQALSELRKVGYK